MQKAAAFWLGVFIVFFQITGITQNSPQEFSLQQCLSYALEHHPTVEQAQLEIGRGQEVLRQYLSDGLPQVSASAQMQANPKLATQYIPDFFNGNLDQLVPVQFGTRYSTQAGVSFQQMVYNQSFWLGMRAGRKLNELNELQLAQTKENLVYKVAQLYLQILLNRRQQGSLEASLSQTDQLLSSLESQYQNGLARRIDIDQLRVNRVNVQTQLDNERLQEDNLLQSLKTQLSLPPDAALILTDTLIEQLIQPLTDPAAAAPVTLQILDKQQELQNINTSNTRADYFPRLNLYGNLNLQWQGNQLGELGKSRLWSDFSSVGLQLQVPIFNGMRTPSRVQQSRIESQQLSAARRLAARQLQQQEATAANQIRIVENLMRASEENRRLAAENYRTVEGQYRNGLATVTELLSAQTAWQQADVNYLVTVVQLQLGRLDQLYAQGRIMRLLN